jgi:putative sigma-54 modulation protein
MEIHLSGRGVAVPAALRRRIESKIGKLRRILPKIIEARAVLAVERHRHLAEVTLQAKGATLRAESVGRDFHAAVDLAIELLREQVRRRKERIRGRKPRVSRRPVSQAPVSAPAAPGDDSVASGPAPLIVRRLATKPMTVEEALEQMRLRPRSMLVFTNARSRAMNVLHRRGDGQLELVQPGG